MSIISRNKNRLENIIISSQNLEQDLIFFIIEISEDMHQVDLYNMFYKQLRKAEDKKEDNIYEAISFVMDIIWIGKTDNLQLYPSKLYDDDFDVRKTSQRMFYKQSKIINHI